MKKVKAKSKVMLVNRKIENNSFLNTVSNFKDENLLVQASHPQPTLINEHSSPHLLQQLPSNSFEQREQNNFQRTDRNNSRIYEDNNHQSIIQTRQYLHTPRLNLGDMMLGGGFSQRLTSIDSTSDESDYERFHRPSRNTSDSEYSNNSNMTQKTTTSFKSRFLDRENFF